jgi:hypothetical protein
MGKKKRKRKKKEKKRKKKEEAGARARRAGTPEGIEESGAGGGGESAAGRATFMGNRNAAVVRRYITRACLQPPQQARSEGEKERSPAPARRHGIRGEKKNDRVARPMRKCGGVTRTRAPTQFAETPHAR